MKTKIKLNIDGSDVHVLSGDLFKQEGLKVIPFNEYFDTKVDNVIIAERSLNGQYIKKYCENINLIDNLIKEDLCLKENITESNVERNGKAIKYTLGSSVLIEEYVLVAFSKFDKDNKAYLTIHDYLQFLLFFWNEINRIYAQRPVSVPIFGSGITRFKDGFEDIDDNELLNIMIWTFKISKIKFKYPAKLSIIIDEEKINKINIFLTVNKNGPDKKRGLSKSQLCIVVAIDCHKNTYAVICGHGKPSASHIFEALKNHIVSGSTLVHDGERAHNKLIKELDLKEEFYKANTHDKEYLENMTLINNMCSWLKRYIYRFIGMRMTNLYFTTFDIIQWNI